MKESGVEEPSVTGDMHASVAKSTALMSAATLVSRLTGFVRTWAMAFALGNSVVTSAYQVANNLPYVLYDVVAGGMLGAAFIPIYLLQKEQRGEKASNEFAVNTLNITMVVLGVLSLASSLFAPQLIATQTFTMNEHDEVVALSVELFRIFAFQIVFFGISGIVTGVLNANRVYFLPSIAPALGNVCVIIAFFLYIPLSAHDQKLAIVALGLGTTFGVALQALVQVPLLVKMGFRYRLHIDLRDPALIEALKIALPTMLYIAGTLVAFSCRNAFSLQVSDNGPATLLYAWTWYMLPYGIVSVSLTRALFTEIGEASAHDDNQSVCELVRSGIAGNLFLIVPLSCVMLALSTPLMELFQAGAFHAGDVSYVSNVLSLWLLSLPFYSVLMFLYNVFAAIRRFMRFAVVSTAMVVVQCLLYFVLCRQESAGLGGVPLADLVYNALCCVILMAMLRPMIGPYGLKSILWSACRVTAASIAAAAVVSFISSLIPVAPGMLGGFIRIVVAGGIGLVVAFGLCALFRVPEMNIARTLLEKLKIKRGE